MKKQLSSLLLSAFVMASSAVQAETEFSTVSSHAPLGSGASVTLENQPLSLKGAQLEVDQPMISAVLKDIELHDVDTPKADGKVKVFSIVTSVDTPVCDKQLHELSDFLKDNSNSEWVKDIEFYAVSADTPFAQARFVKAAEINQQIVFLSDSKDHQFGLHTGTEIAPLGLLTRTIIVVDQKNTIKYIQRVPELTTLPKLKDAVDAARSLLKS